MMLKGDEKHLYYICALPFVIKLLTGKKGDIPVKYKNYMKTYEFSHQGSTINILLTSTAI